MAQLGKAFIEVRADVSKLPAELKKLLAAAVKDGVAGVDFQPLADKASDAGATAADAAGKSFEQRGRSRFRRAGEEGGRGLLAGIASVFRRGGSGGAGGGLFRGIFAGISDTLSKGLAGVQGAAGGIGGVFSTLAGGGGDIIGGLKIAAIIAAIPVVLALGGALIQLSGALLALPAAGAVAGAILGPLLLAFNGIGEAVGAGLSGDVEAFNEALKKLAPSAAAVVKEIVKFGPTFKAIGREVQEQFFAPLRGQLTGLLQAVLPSFRSGMRAVAKELGNAFSGVVELLGSNDIVDVFDDVFQSAARIVKNLAPSLVDFLGVIFGVIEHGLPFVERVFAAIGRGIERVTGFLSGSLQTGKFEEFLEESFTVAGQLFDLLGEIGGLIGAVFGGEGSGEAGQSFIVSLTEMTKRLKEFFQSAEGQDALDSLYAAAKTIGVALVILGQILIWSIIALDWFGDALEAAVAWVITFGIAAGRWFGMVGETIARWYGVAKEAIVGFFTETIPNAFATGIAWFQALPERIINAIAGFAERLRAWAIAAALGLVEGFFVNIGRLIGFFLILPGLIQNAILAIPGLIAGVFDLAWTWVKERAEAFALALMIFFASIPSRLTAAKDAVVAFVTSIFSSAVTQSEEFVRTGMDRIISFFTALPGRIAALGPRLLEAARELGRKIGQGLSNIGDFASDIGGKIVSTIKSGLNFIIGSINRGIGEIDAMVPGSLPRLPRFERGGIVDSPTVALMGEGNKREVILPLTDPGRTRQLAEQSGLMNILRTGAQAPTVNLTAYLEGVGWLRVVDMRVNEALGNQGSELGYGARS
jgi:phage-related protein